MRKRHSRDKTGKKRISISGLKHGQYVGKQLNELQINNKIQFYAEFKTDIIKPKYISTKMYI